jgi:hypothetical protein
MYMKKCVLFVICSLLALLFVGCTGDNESLAKKYGIDELFAPIQRNQWSGKPIQIDETFYLYELRRIPTTTGGYHEQWDLITRNETRIQINIDDCFGFFRTGVYGNYFQYAIEDQEGNLVKHTRISDFELATEVLGETGSCEALITHLPIPEMPIPQNASSTILDEEIVLSAGFNQMSKSEQAFLYETLQAPNGNKWQNYDSVITYDYKHFPEEDPGQERYALAYEVEYTAESGKRIKATYSLIYRYVTNFSYFTYFTNYIHQLYPTVGMDPFVFEPNTIVAVRIAPAEFGYMKFHLVPGYVKFFSWWNTADLTLYAPDNLVVPKTGEYYVISEPGYYTLRLDRKGNSTGAHIHAFWEPTMPTS